MCWEIRDREKVTESGTPKVSTELALERTLEVLVAFQGRTRAEGQKYSRPREAPRAKTEMKTAHVLQTGNSSRVGTRLCPPLYPRAPEEHSRSVSTRP